MIFFEDITAQVQYLCILLLFLGYVGFTCSLNRQPGVTDVAEP